MDDEIHFGERFATGDELVEELEFTGDPMMQVLAKKPDFRMIDSVLDVLRCKHFAAG